MCKAPDILFGPSMIAAFIGDYVALKVYVTAIMCLEVIAWHAIYRATMLMGGYFPSAIMAGDN